MKYYSFFNTDILKAAGWTLLNSFWQSLVILLLLKSMFSLLKIRHASIRYIIGLTALSAIIVLSCISFNNEYTAFVNTATCNEQLQRNDNSASGISRELSVKPQVYEIKEQENFVVAFLNSASAYITIAWFGGLLLYSVKIAREYVRLHQFRHLQNQVIPGIQSLFDRLKFRMKVSSPVLLIISDKISLPLTFGHFKPVILLPFEYIMKVPEDEVEMILAHELAHIKRSDFLVNLFQSTFEVIYFFNPFFQKLSEIVRTEREYCCDDYAIQHSGNNEQMALALTKLNWLVHNRGLSLYASPSETTFKHRIFRLLYPQHRSLPTRKKSFFSLLLALVFMALLTNCVKSVNKSFDFPLKNDMIQQLYTDNQAGYKVQILGYRSADKPNDILLVSTEKGDPLYAYINGVLLSDNQLKDLYPLINRQKTVTAEQLANIPKSEREINTLRSGVLNHEIDSISKKIDLLEHANNTNKNAADISVQLDMLNKERSVRIDEVVSLSMKNYQEDVKNIDVEVQLHTYLADIVKNQTYTREQRIGVMQLVNKRNSRD